MLQLTANRKYVRHWPILFIVAVLGTGCTSYPEQKRIAAFGDAAATLTRAAASAQKTSQSLAKDRETETATLAYISNGFVSPANDQDLSSGDPQQWKIRINLLGKIANYAEELAKIGTPGAAENAADSASRLATTVAAALPEGSAASLGQGLRRIVGGTVRLGANRFLTHRMRTVMQRTHPVLVEAVELLRSDFTLLVRIPEFHAAALTKIRTDTLERLRQDRRNGTIELRVAYQQLVQMEHNTQAAVAAANDLPATLERLIDAHKAVMESRDDDRALSELIEASNGIANGLAAISPN